MKVLFLIPPEDITDRPIIADRVYGCNYGYDYKTPIHLLSAATCAVHSGAHVQILDCPGEGISRSGLVKLLKRDNFEVVVFFVTWLSADIDLAASELVSSLQVGALNVFMGAYPTWRPELFLRSQRACVVRGEPENTLQELFALFPFGDDRWRNIAGISLNQQEVKHNPYRPLADISLLPIPDRALLKGRYFSNRLNVFPVTVMCSSRGCTFRCSYCAPHALDQAIELEHKRQGMDKPALRQRTAQQIIDEFRQIAALGYKGVEICDNQFVWNAQKVLEVCEAITSFDLKWTCYARADYLQDKTILDAMRQAGCVMIYIGTESFDQQVLDDVCKDCKVSDYDRAVRLVQGSGIQAEISVMIGASRFETKVSVEKTIDAARRMGTRFVHYSIALPLPNTRLYELAVKNGWMNEGDFIPVDNVRQGAIDLPGLSAFEMRRLLRAAYLKQYFSFGFIFSQIISLRSWRILVCRIRAFVRFISSLRENAT